MNLAQRHIFDDFHTVLLYLIIFSLPFNTLINSYLIILLAFIWLFRLPIKLNLKFNPYALILFSYICLLIIGIFYSSNVSGAYFTIEKNLSFVFFTFFFICDRNNKRINPRYIFIIIFISILLIVLISIYISLIHYGDDFYTAKSFYYSLILHPTYYAMYAAVCGLYFLDQFIKLKKYTYLIFFLISLLIIIYSSARMPLFGYLSVSIFYLFLQKKYLVLFAIMIIASVLSISINSFLKKDYSRFIEGIIEVKWTASNTGDSEAQLRISRVKCAIDTWYEDFWFGAGTGDDNDVLTKCYYDQNMTGFDRTFNAHNIYLQSALKLGFIGLVQLLLILMYPLKKAIQYKDYFYISFILLFCICGFTESLLTVQKGIVFFAFFNSMLYSKLLSNE